MTHDDDDDGYTQLRSTLVGAYEALADAAEHGDKLAVCVAAHTLGILLRDFIGMSQDATA